MTPSEKTESAQDAIPEPPGYLVKRLADFADIFSAEVTVGPVIDVHANATSFLGMAIGFSYGHGFHGQYGYGFHGRYAGKVVRVSWPLFGSIAGIDEDGFRERWQWHMKATSGGAWLPEIEGLTWMHPFPGLRAYGFNVGASAIVGIDVGVNPAELVDFVLGWTTFDMAGDDHD